MVYSTNMKSDISDTLSKLTLMVPEQNDTPQFSGNSSVDIIHNGCFTQYSTVACIRNGVMAAVMIVTALLCVGKVVRLHVRRHPTVHQYIIFYCAAPECLLGATNLILGRYMEMEYVVEYLKLVQFVVINHFYWTLASRVMRKEVLSKWLLFPAVVGTLLYFTAVTIYGIVNSQTSWNQCFQPLQWMMLSSVEFVLVQLFFVAGFYISRRLNEISTLESVRWAQKRDLWSIILVFEFSALVGLVYDITALFMGSTFSWCSGDVWRTEIIYTPVFVAFLTVKYLLPLWMMLVVFQPMPACQDMDELVPALSDEGTYTSVFSPAVNHTYRPLYLPGQEPAFTHDLSPPLLSSWSHGSPRRKASSLAPISEEQQHHQQHQIVGYQHQASTSLPETDTTSTSSSAGATPHDVVVTSGNRLRGVRL